MSVIQQSPSQHTDSRSALPRAWVVSRLFGAASEVWMRRQIDLMERLAPQVVCWGTAPDASPGIADGALVIDADADADRGLGKWLARLRNSPSRNFCAPNAAEMAAIESLIEQSKPEVILCHFGHIALRILPVAKRMGIPVVAHFHGLDLSSSLRNRWYRWSIWQHLNEFAAAVVVGSHQKRLLLAHGMAESRVHLIPCGVPTGDFTPRIGAPRMDRSEVVFACVGRLVEWKGPEYSIRALAQLRTSGVIGRLVIVGDGPMRHFLQQLCHQLSLGDTVSFLGSRNSDEVGALLRDADIFLQHSLNAQGCSEGFGVSIAEASACGLPVVVTSCGGIEDQVIHGETGLVVQQRDVAGMADAMLTLARDPELRKRLGDAGRARVVKHFDTAGQVRKLEDVLLSAAKAKMAGGGRS